MRTRRFVAAVLVCALAVLAYAAPAVAQERNFLTLAISHVPGADAQEASVSYSRLVTSRVSLGLTHPAGALFGVDVDGELNVGDLDYEFEGFDRFALQPTVGFHLTSFADIGATFGGVCVLHTRHACDGYVSTQISANVTMPWAPITFSIGREGLWGDGELGGTWLSRVSVGHTLRF